MKRILRRNAWLTLATMVFAGAAMAGTPDHDSAATKDPLTEHYLAIQTALAADSLDGVAEHAKALKQTLTSTAEGEAEKKELQELTAASHNLAEAKDLDQARKAFGKLSETLIHQDGLLPTEGAQMAFCPMADKHWLQAGDKIANPYYGSRMLRCGTFVKQPKHTDR